MILKNKFGDQKSDLLLYEHLLKSQISAIDILLDVSEKTIWKLWIVLRIYTILQAKIILNLLVMYSIQYHIEQQMIYLLNARSF